MAKKIKLDPLDRLYRAAAKYIESKGGTAVVAGGVEIQQFPGEGEYKYRLAIRICGRPPRKEK